MIPKRKKTAGRSSQLVLWLIVVLGVLYTVCVNLTPHDDASTPLLAHLPPSADDAPSRHLHLPSSFRLAYEQSFGFFDDITDENWKRSQSIHSKLFPNHYGRLNKYSSTINDKGNIKVLQPSSWWYAENFQEEFHCAYAQRIPTDSDGDGPKWVCDPHRVAKNKDCLIYSFGSNGKVQFEKGVKQEIGEHCEIHTFDPITYNKRNGHFAEALEGYATFHPWGLGTEEQMKEYNRTGRGLALKTLDQTVKELGHEGRRIDVFKIDCEWCEWSTYRDWLDHDIRQVLVETHNAPQPEAGRFFFDMHDAGFVIFSKEGNFQNSCGGVEYAWVKLRTDFFVNNSMYSKQKAVA